MPPNASNKEYKSAKNFKIVIKLTKMDLFLSLSCALILNNGVMKYLP